MVEMDEMSHVDIKVKIEKLYNELHAAENVSLIAANTSPRFPWRNVSDDVMTDEDWKIARNKQIANIQDEIIDYEHMLRDPIQDSEMRMEAQAEMAMTGVFDNLDDYFNTPMEEMVFQDRIERQVMFDDDYGYYDYWHGPCDVCGMNTDEDSIVRVLGWDFCYSHCGEEAVAFLYFLSFVMGYETFGSYDRQEVELIISNDEDEEW